jgi:glutamyl-tRNA reductase
VIAYGSLAARFVPAGRRVVLVGTGALAADLSAALAERHQIDHWGRRPGEGRHGYSVLSTAAFGPARSTEAVTLIVAAPVSQADIEPLAVCYPRIFEVIDLRGRHERHACITNCRLITLDDLFREAAELDPGVQALAAARREIRELSRAFADRDELRPLGWDDLCA